MDGTLWDVSEACAKAWNKALSKYQIDDFLVTPDDIRSVSGLPFEHCVSSLFEKLEVSDLNELSKTIDREEKGEISVIQEGLYEGVRDGVFELSSQLPLFLVSNCQDWYLDSFWRTHGLQNQFNGSNCYGSSRVSKKDMIIKICKDHSLTHPIYIGDTKGDQLASKEAGVAFGFMSYGFGNTSEADLVFGSFEELVAFFRNTHN